MASVVITSRLPAAQAAKLDAIAKDLGISRAEAIQAAITQWLKTGARVPAAKLDEPAPGPERTDSQDN